MNGFFLVALGGAIGAIMRYGAGLAIGNGAAATLFVNVAGSFALGLLTAYGVARNFGGEQALWLLVGVGVLGAFTTFSTFSRETIFMFMEGETLKGLSFVALNMVGSLGAFAIGLFTLRRLLS